MELLFSFDTFFRIINWFFAKPDDHVLKRRGKNCGCTFICISSRGPNHLPSINANLHVKTSTLAGPLMETFPWSKCFVILLIWVKIPMHLQSDSFKEMFDVSLMHLMNKETMFIMSWHRSTFKEENDLAPYLYPKRETKRWKKLLSFQTS